MPKSKSLTIKEKELIVAYTDDIINDISNLLETNIKRLMYSLQISVYTKKKEDKFNKVKKLYTKELTKNLKILLKQLA